MMKTEIPPWRWRNGSFVGWDCEKGRTAYSCMPPSGLVVGVVAHTVSRKSSLTASATATSHSSSTEWTSSWWMIPMPQQ